MPREVCGPSLNAVFVLKIVDVNRFLKIEMELKFELTYGRWTRSSDQFFCAARSSKSIWRLHAVELR